LRDKDGQLHEITNTQAQNLTDALQKLSKQTGMAPQIAILKSEQVNALATKHLGKPMVVFTLPFVRALGGDKDAVASVMGHELAHLKLEHAAARRERNDTAQGASNVLGAILNVVGVPLGPVIAGVGVSAVTSAFSRDEEREADELGNQWAAAAGFDPCGGARSMRVLQQASRSTPIPFLSTHPGHEERIERANQLSIKLRGSGC
jgi:predicted Zn-dependent protease